MTAVDERRDSSPTSIDQRCPGGTERAAQVVQRGLGTLGESATGSVRSFGGLIALTVDTVIATVDAVVHRRFSYAEFFDQAWFLVSVSLLPTLLIALPFGLVLVLEVGTLANQIGAPSFVGAVDAVGTVR